MCILTVYQIKHCAERHTKGWYHMHDVANAQDDITTHGFSTGDQVVGNVVTALLFSSSRLGAQYGATSNLNNDFRMFSPVSGCLCRQTCVAMEWPQMAVATFQMNEAVVPDTGRWTTSRS